MNESRTVTATQPPPDNRPPMVVLRDKLLSRKGELRAALTDVSVESFIRAVMTSVALNPDILTCGFQSVWNSCLKACRDGLVPDGIDAALVPFKGVCSYVPMYQGLLRRFRRSGQFRWVTAGVVRQGEEFEHWIDQDGEHLRHVPGDNFAAPLVKCYALATTKDGGIFVAVLPIAEADKMRSMSKATRDDSPWRIWPEEMYKKTALHRLSKYLPSARDLDTEDPHEAEQLATVSGTDADLPRITADTRSALDHFAGGDDRAPKQIEHLESEQPMGGTAQALELAHSAGKDARAGGLNRRALPGEYRTPERQHEAVAWMAGWDGAPLPTGEIVEQREG